MDYPVNPTTIEERSNTERWRRWSLGVIVVAWLVTLAVNAPGHLSFDSIQQLHEGRFFVFEGHHPPFMSLLLGIFDRILPGTALYLVFVQSFYFVSLMIIVLRARIVRWWTSLAIALVCAAPIGLIYQGIVWKDVLFCEPCTRGLCPAVAPGCS
jgi:hypothetical protein